MSLIILINYWFAKLKQREYTPTFQLKSLIIGSYVYKIRFIKVNREQYSNCLTL